MVSPGAATHLDVAAKNRPIHAWILRHVRAAWCWEMASRNDARVIAAVIGGPVVVTASRIVRRGHQLPGRGVRR